MSERENENKILKSSFLFKENHWLDYILTVSQLHKRSIDFHFLCLLNKKKKINQNISCNFKKVLFLKRKERKKKKIGMKKKMFKVQWIT